MIFTEFFKLKCVNFVNQDIGDISFTEVFSIYNCSKLIAPPISEICTILLLERLIISKFTKVLSDDISTIEFFDKFKFSKFINVESGDTFIIHEFSNSNFFNDVIVESGVKFEIVLYDKSNSFIVLIDDKPDKSVRLVKRSDNLFNILKFANHSVSENKFLFGFANGSHNIKSQLKLFKGKNKSKSSSIKFLLAQLIVQL